MTSAALTASERVPEREAVPGEVRKGPFRVRERMVTKSGREFLELEVRIEGDERDWPANHRYSVVEDDEGLPVMFWLERDKFGGWQNAGIEWAPRGCFIWRSRFKDQPIRFVHANMDGKGLPTPQRSAIMLATIGAYWGFIYLVGGIEAAMFLTLLTGFVPIVLALVFIKIATELRIWSGIPMNFAGAPWAALEGFEMADAQNLVGGIPNRTIVSASFGRTAPAIHVMHGRWAGEQAREWIRMLMLRFCDERPGHFQRLGLDRSGLPG